MENNKDLKIHFTIREINRLKIGLYKYAFVFILLIIIALIIPDGKEVFLKGGLYYIIGFIIITLTYLYEIWLIAIHNKNPIIMAIDEDGVLLRAIGKSPKKNYFYKRYHYFSKDKLMSFVWDEINQIELRNLPAPGHYLEICLLVKSKTGDEVWCSIEDYSLGRSFTSRSIQNVIYNCTGRSDLFIDKRHKEK